MFANKLTTRKDMRNGDRRQDAATAERIDMALQTMRAFDAHTAKRFMDITGIPKRLIECVLNRPIGKTRRDNLLSSTSYDRRKA
ncbi:MAG TPA: hypothetical protein VFF16_20655 [Telluria sp.]|nr:hypothetical protein [Telluria sp.]